MNHPNLLPPTTIAAVATQPGTVAVGIIRISGPDALSIAEKTTRLSLKAVAGHRAKTATVYSLDGTIIDHVLILIFRAPRSYTGEDSVEIHCHGGAYVVKRVLERVFEAGAVPAQPGEFTLRAYLNQKLDLTQAEAVQQLIAAKNELAQKSATSQLGGSLSEKIRSFQLRLTPIAALIEAYIDFPEEGLEYASKGETLTLLNTICQEMIHLRNTFHEGRKLHQNARIALIGTPNVGKSSLMNALLGVNRAIVTPIPGTTRDFIEAEMQIGSFSAQLIDTAGISETIDPIEQEGIERSKALIQNTDIVLLLLDASRSLSSFDLELLAVVPKDRTLLVWNKTDIAPLNHSISWNPMIAISATRHQNLDALKEQIEQMLIDKEALLGEEVVITSCRHHAALSTAISSCQAVICGLEENLSYELISSDMIETLNQLAKIIGTNVSEDVLNSIFSQFCVGK